jgi:Na+/melibiose symporter-like transporter
MVAFDIVMALYIYFMRYALKISDDLSYIFMAIPLIAAVAATPVWVAVSNKLGKEKTYVISAIYFVIPLLACLVLPANNVVLTVIDTILIGIGISASQVLVFSILPDVVEVDESKNGTRREGTIYGATMFIYKISSAIIVALVTAAMGLFGYVESTGTTVVEQTPTAILGIRILMSCMPVICLLLSVFFIKRLSLGKDSFDSAKKTIAKV